MRKYRIVPDGSKWWNVQRRLFGVLWWSRANYMSLDSEQEAETWIRYALSHEAEQIAADNAARDRRKNIVPRVFP